LALERADGVGVEIVERNGRRAVVRGLGRSVDDDRWAQLRDKVAQALPIPDVKLVMLESPQLAFESPLIPACVALRAKENGALVVVDPVYKVACPRKVGADLAADQAR
jgi:hypothetical protein